jgi:hypothetical protein
MLSETCQATPKSRIRAMAIFGHVEMSAPHRIIAALISSERALTDRSVSTRGVAITLGSPHDLFKIALQGGTPRKRSPFQIPVAVETGLGGCAQRTRTYLTDVRPEEPPRNVKRPDRDNVIPCFRSGNLLLPWLRAPGFLRVQLSVFNTSSGYNVRQFSFWTGAASAASRISASDGLASPSKRNCTRCPASADNPTQAFH